MWCSLERIWGLINHLMVHRWLVNELVSDCWCWSEEWGLRWQTITGQSLGEPWAQQESAAANFCPATDQPADVGEATAFLWDSEFAFGLQMKSLYNRFLSDQKKKNEISGVGEDSEVDTELDEQCYDWLVMSVKETMCSIPGPEYLSYADISWFSDSTALTMKNMCVCIKERGV